MSEYAISVEHISKVYKLYRSKADRLKDSLHLTRKKNYEEFYALSDVNFQVKKGEIFGLVGESGSDWNKRCRKINTFKTAHRSTDAERRAD